jgi:P4 family phage/plasmid primase-like protien
MTTATATWNSAPSTAVPAPEPTDAPGDRPFGTYGVEYADRLSWYVGPCCWVEGEAPTDGTTLPCACGRHRNKPDSAGKAPISKHGHEDFTNEDTTIDAWLARYPELAKANLGVDLERSGLLVLDGDSAEAVAEIKSWLVGYPKGPVASTGRADGSGMHFFFRRPAGCPSARAIHAGQSGHLDVLAKGYVILPPSRHRSGRKYEWEAGPDQVDLPDAPPQAVAILMEAAARSKAGSPDARPVVASDSTEPPCRLGEREMAYWRQEDFVTGPNGRDRSGTIFALACAFAKTGLPQEETVSTVAGWDARLPDPKYARRPNADAAYRRDVANAYAQVAEERATVADTFDPEGGVVEAEGRQRRLKQGDGTVEIVLDQSTGKGKRSGRGRKAGHNKTGGPSVIIGKGATDAEWRDAYINNHGGDNVAYGRLAWRRYEAGVWGEIEEARIRREIAVMMGDKATHRAVTGALSLLRDWVFEDNDAWDADPDAFVCSNGTLDLASGELRPHDPDDLATVAVPYAYDPDATAPAWEHYLSTTLDQVGPGIRDFVQEFAGYCLTPDTSHEVALWFLSPPGAGKSTCLTGLQALLGPARCGVLSLRDIEDSRFGLAGIPGKTLLTATEQPAGYLDKSDTINALISGEPLTVERKNRDAYTYQPVAKLAWAMNALPRVADPNNGLYRRVKIIRLPAALPEGERDTTLKGRIALEGPGILNWALAGLARLRARGRFDIPACVTAAVNEFRQSNDVAAEFLDEKCVRGSGPDAKVAPAALYRAYASYCAQFGHKPKAINTVSADWERLGLVKKKVNGAYEYRGARLLAVESTTDAAPQG